MADKQSLSSYKIPGTRTPRNRQGYEKPVDGKKTFKRLLFYFADEKKKIVLNADVLERLQEQVKNLYHNSNGVTVDGLDWYLKLMVVPISTDTEVCSRIYKKLNQSIFYLCMTYICGILSTIAGIHFRKEKVLL